MLIQIIKVRLLPPREYSALPL